MKTPSGEGVLINRWKLAQFHVQQAFHIIELLLARPVPAGSCLNGECDFRQRTCWSGLSPLARSGSRFSFNVGCEGKQVVLIVVDQITLVMEEEHPFVAFSSPSTAPLPDKL